jgi:hypothetical protein
MERVFTLENYRYGIDQRFEADGAVLPGDGAA